MRTLILTLLCFISTLSLAQGEFNAKIELDGLLYQAYIDRMPIACSTENVDSTEYLVDSLMGRVRELEECCEKGKIKKVLHECQFAPAGVSPAMFVYNTQGVQANDTIYIIAENLIIYHFIFKTGSGPFASNHIPIGSSDYQTMLNMVNVINAQAIPLYAEYEQGFLDINTVNGDGVVLCGAIQFQFRGSIWGYYESPRVSHTELEDGDLLIDRSHRGLYMWDESDFSFHKIN